MTVALRGLDQALPEWHFHERHALEVRASGVAVMRAVRMLRAADVPFTRALMGVRALPAVLIRGAHPEDTLQPHRNETLIDHLLRTRFRLLVETPGQEIVLGLIGKFWLPNGELRTDFNDLEGFHARGERGEAKAAFDFRVEPGTRVDGVRLVTETRVLCLDQPSRRRFGLYWGLIQPGSALIRMEWMRAIRRIAETG